MAFYPFQCRTCNFALTIEAPVGSTVTRPDCPMPTCEAITPMARIYSFSAAPGFEDHYSHAAGGYVATRTKFRDMLKAKNDEMTARVGYDQDMQPTSWRELAARSIDGETLDMLRREHKDPEPFPKALVEAVEHGKV
jgi:hypothetical protein